MKNKMVIISAGITLLGTGLSLYCNFIHANLIITTICILVMIGGFIGVVRGALDSLMKE